MTCGTCRYFAKPIEEDGTCFAMNSPRPLFEDIRATDEACARYVPCEIVQLRTTPAPDLRKPLFYRDPLDMLSEETRSKLNRPPRRWQEG